jgi:hypothetical protein
MVREEWWWKRRYSRGCAGRVYVQMDEGREVNERRREVDTGSVVVDLHDGVLLLLLKGEVGKGEALRLTLEVGGEGLQQSHLLVEEVCRQERKRRSLGREGQMERDRLQESPELRRAHLQRIHHEVVLICLWSTFI